MYARPMNHIPNGRSAACAAGVGSVPFAWSSCRMKKAIQNAPQAPCASVATTSRALYAHMPASSCAMPPNVRQKGATARRSAAVPHHFAWIVATIIVATEKPASPSTDGAAIGCRKTRVAQPFVPESVPARAVALRSSIVLIYRSPPTLRRIAMYSRHR